MFVQCYGSVVVKSEFGIYIALIHRVYISAMLQALSQLLLRPINITYLIYHIRLLGDLRLFGSDKQLVIEVNFSCLWWIKTRLIISDGDGISCLGVLNPRSEFLTTRHSATAILVEVGFSAGSG